MASSIDAIRGAEVKAEELVKNAAEEAMKIIDEAHAEATKLQIEAESAAKDKAALAVGAAHERSQEMLEKSMAEFSDEMRALREKAAAAQPRAVKIIVDAIA